MKRILRAVSSMVAALLITAVGVVTLASATACTPTILIAASRTATAPAAVTPAPEVPTPAVPAPAAPVTAAPAPEQTVVAPEKELTPDEYYHLVWQKLSENFLYQERLKDWSKWEHKYDGKLTTHADAERAINTMVDSLGDKYTYFKNSTLTKANGSRDDATNVVSHSMLPGNIGYIRITTFSSRHSSDEAEAALKYLSGADAYILDLRGNSGGYVKEAAWVFSLFVDKGTFTTLRGHYQGKPYEETIVLTDQRIEMTVSGNVTPMLRMANTTGSKPVIVLVDKDSASASEMLAGALRDSGRAELVGSKTYGKGIAQVTKHLPRDTSVQITYARYYLPKGASIHGVGITPNRVVSLGIADRPLAAAKTMIARKLGR